MINTAKQSKTRRRTSASRLLLTVLVSILLFIGLALGEDYGRRALDRRQASQTKVDKRVGAEKTVREYAETLPDTHRGDDPAILEQAGAASDEQVARVRALMTYNRLKKKQTLLLDLKDQQIEAVEIAGAEATVTATETWTYSYVAKDSGRQMSSGTQTLKTDYKLINSAGKWLVDLATFSPDTGGGESLFSDPEAENWAAGENAVGQYVEALAEAYLAGNPAVLEYADVATAAQVTNVRLFMAYNHFEKKQKLLAQLQSQQVEEVQIAGDEATVTATETWAYAYFDEATAKEVSSTNQAVNVVYQLKRSAGQWLVDDLVAAEVEG